MGTNRRPKTQKLVFSSQFGRSLHFVLLGGLCTKRRPWLKSISTAYILLFLVCAYVGSDVLKILSHFGVISRGFRRGLRFVLFFGGEGYVQNKDPGYIFKLVVHEAEMSCNCISINLLIGQKRMNKLNY